MKTVLVVMMAAMAAWGQSVSGGTWTGRGTATSGGQTISALDFVTCTFSPCNNGQTHFSTIPWVGEDVGSLNTNIGFINPQWPTDNFTPTANLSAIGYVAFDPSQAGRRVTTLSIGPVPNTFPVTIVDSSTDYLP